MDILGLHVVLPDWLHYLNSPTGTFFANLLAWFLIAIAARYFTRYLVSVATRRSTTPIDDQILAIVRRPLVLMILAYGFLAAWELAFGESGITNALQRLYNGLLIVLAAYVAWRVLFQVILAHLRPRVQESDSQADDIIIPILSRIGPVVIIIAVANAVVATLGGNLSALMASLGLLGLVLGYLFQEPLQGLFSGTYMALDNPFRTDDLIILEDGTTCQVRNVGVRVTQLYDIKRHVLLYMPNAKLAANKIVNLTKPSVELRTVLTVAVSKACDSKTAIALLTEACNSHENILGEWQQKQAAIRRRQAVYRGEYEALLALPEHTPSQENQIAWLRDHLVRLEGEVIRLQVEHDLRERGEQFSKELLAMERFCSLMQQGGLSASEKEKVRARVEELLAHFGDLIEQITVWLYLVKIIESELIDESYHASIALFIERDLLHDGRLTLHELALCQAPGAPTRPMVERAELCNIRSSDIEAEKAIDRNQFRDRASYTDYRRLYAIWHRNIVFVYRRLDALAQIERLRSDQANTLADRVRVIERHFSDTFLLRVSYWQLPFAHLVDATDTALKFELAFFVDDVVREQFQRSSRVTTELLIEIDRQRSLYYASRAGQ